MNALTEGVIKGRVSWQDMLAYLSSKYHDVKEKSICTAEPCDAQKEYLESNLQPEQIFSTPLMDASGEITFTNETCRYKMSYLYRTYADINEIKCFEDEGNKEMADVLNGEVTFISMIVHHGASDIIEDVIRHFGGGWQADCVTDEDSCYYRVDAGIADIGS